MITKCKLVIGQDLNTYLELWNEVSSKGESSIAFTSNAASLEEKIQLLPFFDIEIINLISKDRYSVKNFSAYQGNNDKSVYGQAQLFFHSSGSTEGFKWSSFLPEQCLRTSELIYQHLQLKENDRIAITAPLFHTFGFNIGLLTGLRCDFTSFSQIPKDKWLNELREEDYTHIFGVPTIFNEVLKLDKVSPKLRGGIIGGAMVSKSLFDDLRERHSIKELTVGYGMTEMGPIITHTNLGEGLICDGDVGVPLGCEVFIDEGILKAQGSGLAKSIVSKVDDGFKRLIPGQIKTGDLFEQREGRFVYKGRANQAIERGGEILSLEYAEDILSKEIKKLNPETDILCFKARSRNSRFNDQLGIALKNSSKSLEGKISTIVEEKLGSFFKEITLIEVENFPYSDSGKVIRKEMDLTKRRIAS